LYVVKESVGTVPIGSQTFKKTGRDGDLLLDKKAIAKRHREGGGPRVCYLRILKRGNQLHSYISTRWKKALRNGRCILKEGENNRNYHSESNDKGGNASRRGGEGGADRA